MGGIEEDCFGLMRSEFGQVHPVRRFTLSSTQMSVQVITLGASITAIKVPCRHGTVDDVVLGWANVQGYIDNHYYFGSTIGRVANRISGGSFRLHNEEFHLPLNDGGAHHLHGGFRGFDKVLWDSHVEGRRVTFSYVSCEWEEGYPGQLSCQVSYELTGENELSIQYKATTNRATPVNLTNHTYFNLSGHASGPIYAHRLEVYADYFTPSEYDIPTGAIVHVEDTPFDLRHPEEIGVILSRMPECSLDHNFCVDGENGTKKIVAKLYDPRTGRLLHMYSTQPGVQVYSGNFLPITESVCGKDRAFYKRHHGICLEAQNFPDAVNKPHFPNSILEPGHTYEHVTTYCFLTAP